MRRSLELLRHEPRARAFFAAHAQSSIGNGVAYVGLLVLALDRLPSPLALTLVLLADFLPAMLLGPLFGAAADRWSRRWCAVASDAARAVAFVAIAAVDSFGATLALALVGGVGTGLYTPTVLAGLPRLVSDERLPAATSLYGALDDAGHMVGPAVAGAILLVAGPETLMALNGATFAISALVLTRVPLGDRPSAVVDEEGRRASLLAEARTGLASAARMPGVRALLLSSSAVILFAGMMNVGELLLARVELGAGDAGFAALVTAFGLGVIAGSLVGGRGGDPEALVRRYLAGIVATAAGLAAAGLAPTYAAALAAFLVTGIGNGLVLVHVRLILQRTVTDRLRGRVFGLRDALDSWAFAGAFAAAGTLVALVGIRPLFLIAAAGTLAVWVAAALTLRGAWKGVRAVPAAETPAPAAADER
jgi:MFS family permease